jgi:hypothetical protein
MLVLITLKKQKHQKDILSIQMAKILHLLRLV